MRRLVLFGVLLLSACGHRAIEAPRILRIAATADPAFRARPHWRDVISSRIHNVSLLFDPEFGVRLELVSASEWNPDRGLDAESQRRQLGGFIKNGDLVLLGLAAPIGGGPEPGSTVAYDPRVLVFDFPARSEGENERLLAHQIAHLLGAWHSHDASSLLYLPPGGAFDSNARQAIRATSSVPLGAGAAGMNDSTANRLNQLFAGSKSDPALNPLFNSYLMTGHELLNNRKVQEALEPLSRASALVPDNANAHYLLGRADLAIQRFGDAAFQFHKVLDLDPRHIPAWNNLGGALLQQGQPAEALAAFGKARELEPSNRTIRTNRAVALIRLPGHVDEGIAELQEVLRAEPGLTAAQDALKEGIEVKRKDAERTSASRAPEAAAKPAPAIAR